MVPEPKWDLPAMRLSVSSTYTFRRSLLTVLKDSGRKRAPVPHDVFMYCNLIFVFAASACKWAGGGFHGVLDTATLPGAGEPIALCLRMSVGIGSGSSSFFLSLILYSEVFVGSCTVYALCPCFVFVFSSFFPSVFVQGYCVSARTRAWVSMYVYMYLRMHARACVCVCVCACVCACVPACVPACVCVYERERERERIFSVFLTWSKTRWVQRFTSLFLPFFQECTAPCFCCLIAWFARRR